MTKTNIKKYVINIFCVVGVFCIFLLYMNQDIDYPIKGKELENTFLQDIEQRHNFKNGKVIDKEVYKNSITLFYEGEYDNIAVATYIKSLYHDKWKEVWTMTWDKNKGDWEEGYHIAVNDHIYVYNTEYVVKQGRFYVNFENVTKPKALLLNLGKFFIIVLCALIGNSIGNFIRNRNCI